MEQVLFQFGLDGGPLNIVISMFFLVVFFMFYPRLMLGQIMWKLEKTVRELEGMAAESKNVISREITKKPDKKVKEAINRFYEFFMITPVSLDPYGIVKKVEHLVEGQRERFRYFVRQTAPSLSEEKQANIQMGLAGGITLYELAKIVTHYVELAKKTKSFQIAMILQMQLPLVESIARSVFRGTKTLARGEAIGDALGPYIVVRMMGNEKARDVGEEMMMVRKNIRGREVFLLKAKGPGGRLGRPGLIVNNLMKQHKIAKIISIDAAAKLEGEVTGSVAEGIGVAMGGIGVERSYIEDVAVKNNIPLDSVIVKMSQEEAIEPLRKKIIDAYPKVIEAVDRSLETVKAGSKVIIVGVGNTSGIGNGGSLEEVERLAEKREKEIEEHKKHKKHKHKAHEHAEHAE